MSLLGSRMALEDVGALLLGNSFLTADPMGPLLDRDEEDDLSLAFSFSCSEGGAATSPPLSLATYTSSLSPSSEFSLPSPPRLSFADSLPPSPTPSLLGTGKAAEETDPLLLPLTPWLGGGELLDDDMGTECRDDAFSGMDWMAEKIDLSDFDLDSLIGSCSSDDAPSSPEELLASLESQMDLDLVDPFAAPVPAPDGMLSLGVPLAELPPLALPTLELPDEVDEVEVLATSDGPVFVKSEPRSPTPPSPVPQSPAYTLELGSEVDVDVLDVKIAAVIPEPLDSPQASPVALTLSPSGHYVVVVTPKDEPTSPFLAATAPDGCEDDRSDDSDSGIDSVSGSPLRRPDPSPTPPAGSSRTKPYSRPGLGPAAPGDGVKSVSGAPKVVERKLKKMEQNKTAATRYRQKKRSEQDVLNAECADLEARNRGLAEKADGIAREIQYLKDLMEEVRSAKGRKKAPVVA